MAEHAVDGKRSVINHPFGTSPCPTRRHDWPTGIARTSGSHDQRLWHPHGRRMALWRSKLEFRNQPSPRSRPA